MNKRECYYTFNQVKLNLYPPVPNIHIIRCLTNSSKIKYLTKLLTQK